VSEFKLTTVAFHKIVPTILLFYRNSLEFVNRILIGVVMLQKLDPTQTTSWQALKIHFEEIKSTRMEALFHADPRRFDTFSIRFNDILVDFSKNRLNEKTLALLFQLAEELHLTDAIEKMFRGVCINETENRAVLHVALRNRTNHPIVVDDHDVMPKFSMACRFVEMATK